MPGWDSLESVTRLHDGAQLAGLILLALIAGLTAFVAWQLRQGIWPEWLDVGAYQLRSRFFEIGCAAALALLGVSEIAAYAYGQRQQTLQAQAEQESADRVRKLAAELQAARRPDASLNRALKENSELRQRLIAADNRVAELERTQSQKRLSQDQKRLLIESLRPFSGQGISIASIRGDDDAMVLAQDFVSVFEAAGWDHGEAGILAQQWDRDPVGVEVMLNDSDARGGRITAGIGALINAVRKLGLVYDNTVYMSDDIPSGQAQLRVGKKLRR